jgi:hypothetical protein
MAKAWHEYTRIPCPREPGTGKPAGSQAKGGGYMVKKFLLRGPVIILICLAIGFAIVYGGEWLFHLFGH